MQVSTAQSIDSLQKVSIERWKMWRIIHAADNFYACDSIRAKWQKAALTADSTIKAKSAAIETQRQQIVARDEVAKVQTDRIMLQGEVNKELRKEVRRHKRIAIGAGVIAILALFL